MAGYFVLNRKASGKVFKDGDSSAGYPRVRSAPMRWNDVVGFIQDGFESIAKMANLDPGQIIRMGEASPSSPLETCRDFHSFYVGNFDQFKVAWWTEVGEPTRESHLTSNLALREQMDELGIGRDPKKAAEGCLSWSSLGAEVDGEKGYWKLTEVPQGSPWSRSQDHGRGQSPMLQYQFAVGGFKEHALGPVQALPGAVFDNLYAEMNRAEGSLLSTGARDELFLLSMGLPLHSMTQRANIEGHVFTTDASEDGGDACASTGLTKWGRSRVLSLSHEKDGGEGQAADFLLVIECFAGIGGLKQALDLLGVVPVISIESDPTCSKVIRQQTRHAVCYQKIEDITYEEVKEWRRRFPRVTKVLIGDGWPCINHSQLNPHLKKVSTELWLADWEVLEIYENVAVHLDTERPPLDWFLNDGAQKGELPEEPFPTITRPKPRKSPPEDPAGPSTASQEALLSLMERRWVLSPTLYWYELRTWSQTNMGLAS